jgi:galactonate dehydratase
MAWGSQDGLGTDSSTIGLETYLKNPEVLKVSGGCISLITGPGLGVEVDEERIRDEDRRFKAGEFGVWANPTLRGPGGEIREW